MGLDWTYEIDVALSNILTAEHYFIMALNFINLIGFGTVTIILLVQRQKFDMSRIVFV